MFVLSQGVEVVKPDFDKSAGPHDIKATWLGHAVRQIICARQEADDPYAGSASTAAGACERSQTYHAACRPHLQHTVFALAVCWTSSTAPGAMQCRRPAAY